MSSVLGLERSHTATAADAYDHSISLIDSTNKLSQDNIVESTQASSDSAPEAVDGESPRVSRQWTRPHLRKELARRKYAKYQEEAKEDITTKKATFIDVLYENQRGSFLCGIPLYSANSLLNFDPSSWQTANFQDSPVDISNAQVPDPSWAWEWRSWYVDMSHDVDEEGWEYSFSFSPNFSWHGSHPWFHSFCRRRRWLRKRVKSSLQGGMRENKGGKDPHRLAADYFTIHAPTKGHSRSTSGDRSATRRSSTLAGYQSVEDEEEEITEISNVSQLMTAMKRARVDREKITAVTKFLAQGGDELFYLADNIPAIMDDFIHETSRRQMQSTLLKALDDTLNTTSPPSTDPTKNKSPQHQRIQNLLHAITAAGVPATDQLYWQTLQAKAQGEDVELNAASSVALDSTSEAKVEARDNIAAHIEEEGGLKDEIRGISKDAEISVEPGIRRPNTETEDRSEDSGEREIVDKGKGKGKGKEKA